ncbi:MAG: hypothetical protein KIT84_11695 [Labilithrix sp.]|nr:hypothetical protein [Labilithrix sp.]MCW5811673.1 hypothetical protein [Labilithrix sp.]
MKLVSVLTASTLLVLAACSSDETPATGAGSTSGDQGGGVTGDGVGAANSAPDTNPKGDKYPTTGIGRQEGTVIQNYKFVGYPDAEQGAGLKPISLAQFYDPSGETYKMIHLQAAGSWCSVCRAETTALLPIEAELKNRKVVWIVSLAEGPTPGTPSNETDLKNWIKDFDSPFTHVLDPNNKNLGVFYDRSALPWNADIDARTMKILHSSTGGATTGDKLLEEIDKSLAKLSQ